MGRAGFGRLETVDHRDERSTGGSTRAVRSGCDGRCLGLLLAEGQDPVLVEGDHVPVIGAMADLDQPDGPVHLVGGLLQGPAAILGPVGDLDHRRAVQPVMAVEEDRIVRGIGEDGRRLIEQIGDRVFRGAIFVPR